MDGLALTAVSRWRAVNAHPADQAITGSLIGRFSRTSQVKVGLPIRTVRGLSRMSLSSRIASRLRAIGRRIACKRGPAAYALRRGAHPDSEGGGRAAAPAYRVRRQSTAGSMTAGGNFAIRRPEGSASKRR